MGKKPHSVENTKHSRGGVLALQSSKLPVEEEFHFHCIKPDFVTAINEIRGRAEDLLQTVAASVKHTCVSDWSSTAQDVTDCASSVIDALCNETDMYISDALHQKKAQDASSSGLTMHEKKNGSPLMHAQTNFVSFMTSTSNEKPQNDFDDPVDNSNEPFVPKFSSLENVEGVDVAAFKREFEEYLKQRSQASPPHPLRHVLEKLPETYSIEQLSAPKEEDVKEPLPIEKVELVYVDTVEELEQVAHLLQAEKEIAVDLEAHNYRSFQGFCCLMQISTRKLDIIVDVLQLRSHVGRLLGPVFADSRVVKVFHGSRSDIGWLQRDFGIYVCNLFDTGEATRILKYASNGLAHLLEKHCGFKADKKWQLADWRIRPLQPQAIHYARADTHYLLYCYDVLRRELSSTVTNEDVESLLGQERGAPGICAVLEQSRKLCLSLYEKELYTPESFYDLYQRMEAKSGVLSEKQLSVFAAVYEWRDTLARQLDESPGYLLPRGQLFHIACKIPSSKRELEACLKSKSKILLSRANELLYCIDKATKDTSAARAVLQPSAGNHGTEPSSMTQQNNFSVGDMQMNITFSGFSAKSSSSFGSMKKRKHMRMVESTFEVEHTNTPVDPVVAEQPEQQKEEEQPIVDTKKIGDEKVQEDNIANNSEVPHGTLDEEDFLPLPLSQLSEKKRRKKEAKSTLRAATKHKTGGRQPSTGPEQHSAFDAEKARNKYGRSHRPPKKKGRKRDDKTEEFEIPTGMFNPHEGLLQGKSSSKRSATQVRSGNRSATYKRN